MSSRGRGGGSRMANKRPRQSRKQQCELGSSCPYQHEYQHQLEFAHDGSNTATTTTATPAVGGLSGAGRKVRGGGTVGRNIKPVNGTGTRGRKVAVAADRRRAERTLRQRERVGQGQDMLDVPGDDAREAQRTRWVMRMQQEMEQQQQPRAANCGRGGTGGGGLSNAAGNRSGTRGRRSSPSSDSVQPLPAPSRTSSQALSPSSLRLRHLASGNESETTPSQTGRRSNSTTERKRAAAGTSDGQGGARREQGRDHSREVICIDSDTDDE